MARVTSTTVHGKGQHHGLALALISTTQLMVVLDVSVVNVALPSIQRSLHFSVVNLEWIVNGYTLAFGGLLLLGGRLGDLFGRRRMFITGILLFTAASLFGGAATDQAWLVSARVIQGLGGAIASPAALSLITTTFAEGPERNRAMGVYAAMSGAGGAIGSILGGVLTTELNWRWVLLINVPIGALVALAAPRVLSETVRHAGALDLPGALSATAGVSLLVYSLIHAATHAWSSLWTLVPMGAGIVLLGVFVLVEARSSHPLMPLEIFENRTRAGAYAVALITGAALFSMFFFITLFVQEIRGYSALRAGIAFLPLAVTLVVFAGVASALVNRFGVRLPLLAGLLLATAGLLWLSPIGPSTAYVGGLLGPMELLAIGMGFSFVPLTLAAVNTIADHEAGIASAALNTAQQVGGSLGLAILGTVAATVTRHDLRTAAPATHLQNAMAITHGYAVGFEASAGMLAAAAVIAALLIRVGGSATDTATTTEVPVRVGA